MDGCFDDRACSDDLRAAIGPKTRWVILNSSNNPAGLVYTPEELRALVDVLLEHEHKLVMAGDTYIDRDTSWKAVPHLRAAVEAALVPLSRSLAATRWHIHATRMSQ